jgi:pseudooxynicotine oxidase
VAFGPPGKLDITDEEAVQKAIRGLIPNAEVLGVTGYQWEADPYSRGTWCWYRPRQLTQGLEGLRKAEDGIFMAGADQAEGWRGFVDGAIESGITAARDVRNFMKT